jgi:hypothetical protein
MGKIACGIDGGINHPVLQLPQHNARRDRFWAVRVSIDFFEIFGTGHGHQTKEKNGRSTYIHVCDFYGD